MPHRSGSWKGILTNVLSVPQTMKVRDAGGACCRTRVDDNAGGTLARFSSNVQRYACTAFCAFGFQSDMPPISD